MKNNLIQIVVVLLVSCVLTSLGQGYENEVGRPIKRFLRAGPSLKEESPPLCMYGARYGKRQETSSPLAGALRWGKRQDPLSLYHHGWGKRQAQPLLRWGKRAQDPLRWGKRQALASFWAPFWRSKDNSLKRMIALHESTTPVQDFDLEESNTPTYSWGSKFPVRQFGKRSFINEENDYDLYSDL